MEAYFKAKKNTSLNESSFLPSNAKQIKSFGCILSIFLRVLNTLITSYLHYQLLQFYFSNFQLYAISNFFAKIVVIPTLMTVGFLPSSAISWVRRSNNQDNFSLHSASLYSPINLFFIIVKTRTILSFNNLATTVTNNNSASLLYCVFRNILKLQACIFMIVWLTDGRKEYISYRVAARLKK